MTRPLILIESPYSHPHSQGIRLHEAYLELCLHDALLRGETPIATHKLYTLCLNDKDEAERKMGMDQLHTLLSRTDYHAVYFDLGVSPGMMWGIKEAKKLKKRIELRTLYHHLPSTELLNLLEDN